MKKVHRNGSITCKLGVKRPFCLVKSRSQDAAAISVKVSFSRVITNLKLSIFLIWFLGVS